MTPAPGNYLVVWKKGSDGVWRLKVDTWNDAPAPKAE
jgi:ketosteroid isomerase-like protein